MLFVEIKSNFVSLRLNITRDKEQEEKMSDFILQHEKRISELNIVKENFEQEAVMWKSKYDYLEKMIEPFRVGLLLCCFGFNFEG